MNNEPVKRGKKNRWELNLPIMTYVVADDWIDKLGHETFTLWLRFHTWVDREDELRDYDRIPRSFENIYKTCFLPETSPKVQHIGNLNKESIVEWYKQEQVAERFLEALGIDKELGQSFSCVLPGHEESNPSASIYKSDTGLYIYRDWHNKGGKEIFFLPEVYAAIRYKKVVELSKPEFTTWAIRLLVDLGLISPYPVNRKPLPKEAAPTVKKVYEGFCLLLGCKWLYSPGEPTPFSWRFARAWCGVGQRQAGEAIKYLLKHGYIRIVNEERLKGREMALFTITE